METNREKETTPTPTTNTTTTTTTTKAMKRQNMTSDARLSQKVMSVKATPQERRERETVKDCSLLFFYCICKSVNKRSARYTGEEEEEEEEREMNDLLKREVTEGDKSTCIDTDWRVAKEKEKKKNKRNMTITTDEVPSRASFERLLRRTRDERR
jgi:hypothetical protein